MIIQSEGYAAFLDGLNKEDNPHQYGSTQWNDWNTGYEQAVTDELGELHEVIV